jgi:hypothetical protein
MAKIRIVGDSSGYVEIAAPNAAGNNTLELPSGNTRLVGSDSAGNVSISGIVTAATFSGNVNSTGISTFTSGVVVSAGSTSAPSISPSGDSNTGIFFPSADTIAFGEGGVESARFDSSGNFGLGTNNPQIKLDVRQDSSSTSTMAGIRVQNTNITSGSQSGIAFLNYDNYNAKIYSPRSGSSQGDIVFATNSGGGIAESNVVEKLRIDSSGRVTTPHQPAFMVRGDETGSKASGSKFPFTKTPGDSKVCFDRANNWSNADDRFTAPVAGVYQFTFGLYRQSATSSYFSMAPRINGSQVSNGDTFIFFTAATGESGNTDDGMYGTFYMNLSANDYVELFMRDGSVTITIYNGHSFFGGHLVG